MRSFILPNFELQIDFPVIKIRSHISILTPKDKVVTKTLCSTESEFEETLILLIESYPSIHKQACFRDACEEGHLEVIKYLVKHGVNIHDEEELGLCIAVENGHIDVVKYLVGQGADVEEGLSICPEGEIEIMDFLEGVMK